MAGCLARWSLIAVFSLPVGHIAWHGMIGPSPTPSYFIENEGMVFSSPHADSTNLYLRRTFWVNQRPRHAWLQVLGRDRVEVYINGRLLQEADLPGFAVGVAADITPDLVAGRNLIAIVVRQMSPGSPPVAAVQGACLLGDETQAIDMDDQWRCQSFFERQARWWFEKDFNDSDWALPQRQPLPLRAKVRAPVSATQVASLGRWITSPNMECRTATLRRDFVVQQRPSQAWLRVAATSAYRLAVNGVVLDQQESQLGTDTAVPPVQRTYDLTLWLHAGSNAIALVLTGNSGIPHLLADCEIQERSGNVQYFGTDGKWQARAGIAADWLDETEASGWQPCQVETGDLGMPPWYLPRQTVEITVPWHIQVWQWLGQAGVMAASALAAAIACFVAGRLLSGFNQGAKRGRDIVYLALVLPGLAAGCILLAGYDPRVARQTVYQGIWVSAACAAVLIQWACLALLRDVQLPCKKSASVPAGRELAAIASSPLLLVLMAIGFAVRLDGINAEPLHWDEITALEQSRRVFVHGFPNHAVGASLPTVYTNTSELAFTFTALSTLAFEDNQYAARFPGISWSTLTIGLLYVAGRCMFRSRAVGLAAAAIYTFSPCCIALSNFGRYFGPLQFFTLLTVYCLWNCLQDRGPLKRNYLWLTTASFAAVFLSWEGGALIALGMVAAALLLRRGRLHTVLGRPLVWAGLLVVGLVVLLQLCHRNLQQTQSLWYGISASDASLRAMWPYALFQPWFYIWEASWNPDALLPLLGLVGALFLAVRSPWRRPLRFLLVIFLVTCGATAAALSLIAWRYSHHLTPLLILAVAAALVACGQRLAALVRAPNMPTLWRIYIGGVRGAWVVGFLVVGSGLTLQLQEMDFFRIQGYTPHQFNYGHLQGPARYLGEHVREGDLVLSHAPFVVNHFCGAKRTDFWVHSKLHLPETIDDDSPRLLDRRDGTPAIVDLPSLQNLFARHPRVWYVTLPAGSSAGNAKEVSAFLRQHMDVVYEDYQALVLLRDARFRPAALRCANQEALQNASIGLLP